MSESTTIITYYYLIKSKFNNRPDIFSLYVQKSHSYIVYIYIYIYIVYIFLGGAAESEVGGESVYMPPRPSHSSPRRPSLFRHFANDDVDDTMKTWSGSQNKIGN